MAVGAIIAAVKKVGKKVAKRAVKEGKQLVTPGKGGGGGGGGGDILEGGLSSFKDMGGDAFRQGGNPLHYQTHTKQGKDSTKRNSKPTLHHKGK